MTISLANWDIEMGCLKFQLLEQHYKRHQEKKLAALNSSTLRRGSKECELQQRLLKTPCKGICSTNSIYSIPCLQVIHSFPNSLCQSSFLFLGVVLVFIRNHICNVLMDDLLFMDENVLFLLTCLITLCFFTHAQCCSVAMNF